MSATQGAGGHTPGPWHTDFTPHYLMMMQQRDGQARLSDPITIRSAHHTEEIATVWNYLLPTEANARLIAAAPDLLAACEGMQELLTIAGLDSNSTNQWAMLRMKMWELLEAALTKAR